MCSTRTLPVLTPTTDLGRIEIPHRSSTRCAIPFVRSTGGTRSTKRRGSMSGLTPYEIAGFVTLALLLGLVLVLLLRWNSQRAFKWPFIFSIQASKSGLGQVCGLAAPPKATPSALPAVGAGQDIRKSRERTLLRLIAVAVIGLAAATSAQALTPAPLHHPDEMTTQVRLGCGPGRTMVGGQCVARTTIRQTRRAVRRCARGMTC